MDEIFKKVPLLSFLTFVSYVTYFSYKAGESVFFGSPVSLIQVDFTTLIFTLLRVSMILLALSFIVWFFIVTKSGFLNATRVSIISFAFVNLFGWLTGKGFSLKAFIVSILVYVLVYGFCHFAKNIMSDVSEIKGKGSSFFGFSFLLLIISFLSGNYFGPGFSILKDAEGNVIISEYKDGFLSMKCHSDFSKTFSIIEIKGRVLKNVDKDYLVRNNLKGECNRSIKY